MRQTTLIFIYSLFFFVFSIKSFSKETGVLYLWKISNKEVWKKFGDEELHQKYNGEIKYGKPNGLGIKIYLDGSRYIGDWKSGAQHGQGTLILTDGTKLKGRWKSNKPWDIKKIDIKGRVSNEYVEGVKQKNNRIEGILFFRKEKYSSVWNKIGNEKVDYQYVGQIENNKPNGWGKLTHPSGYIYEGQFKNGKAHGKGSFSYKGLKKGIGEFKTNKPWNVTEYDNESKIVGTYLNGVFKAKEKKIGILFTRKEKEIWIWFEDSEEPYNGQYDGEIENGKPDGHGKLTMINGTKYIGEFKNGAWNGQGIFFFPGGDQWKGEFKEDSPWNVIWQDKNGKILAKWKNGVKKLFNN